jgi:hypothetical protein
MCCRCFLDNFFYKYINIANIPITSSLYTKISKNIRDANGQGNEKYKTKTQLFITRNNNNTLNTTKDNTRTVKEVFQNQRLDEGNNAIVLVSPNRRS